MNETSASSDTATSPRPTSASNGSRPTRGRGQAETLGTAGLSATLTDLSSMECSAHAIRARGGMDPATDERVAAVIAQVESLIHDLVHDAGRVRTGPAAPRSRGRSSDGAAADALSEAEASFRGWLTSPAKPEFVPAGATGGSTSLTEILKQLVVSPRELPVEMAQELGMRPGATLGYAAAELLLAVTDPEGPRCRSYRSAAYYLRDRGNMVFG